MQDGLRFLEAVSQIAGTSLCKDKVAALRGKINRYMTVFVDKERSEAAAAPSHASSAMAETTSALAVTMASAAPSPSPIATAIGAVSVLGAELGLFGTVSELLQQRAIDELTPAARHIELLSAEFCSKVPEYFRAKEFQYLGTIFNIKPKKPIGLSRELGTILSESLIRSFIFDDTKDSIHQARQNSEISIAEDGIKNAEDNIKLFESAVTQAFKRAFEYDNGRHLKLFGDLGADKYAVLASLIAEGKFTQARDLKNRFRLIEQSDIVISALNARLKQDASRGLIYNVTQLLSLGADVNTKVSLRDGSNVHIYVHAMRTQNAQLMEAIFENKGDQVFEFNDKGYFATRYERNLAHIAAETRNREVMETLLRHLPQSTQLNLPENDKSNTTQYIYGFLVWLATPINYCLGNYTGPRGLTPLMVAASHGDKTLYNYMVGLQDIDTNILDACGRTAAQINRGESNSYYSALNTTIGCISTTGYYTGMALSYACLGLLCTGIAFAATQSLPAAITTSCCITLGTIYAKHFHTATGTNHAHVA